ncbi:MAG: hypothetical protein ACOC6A_04835 [Chloroflexota bacterium]
MNLFGWLVRRGVGGGSFVRNVQAGLLLENFFVAAVASVLVIRLYLLGAYKYLIAHAPITGKIAVADLHFAHMLWGGLLMLVGFILVLTFLGRAGQGAGAIIGGIGFGAFIDEVGKLITLDNDYFYQPAIAIIYIMFVALFIGMRAVQRPQRLSQQAALVNALEYAQQAVLRDFSAEDRRHAMSLLEQCDPRDPMVVPLRRAIERMGHTALRPANLLERGLRFLRSSYGWLVQRWWFTGALVCLFVIKSMSDLYQAGIGVRWSEILIGVIAVSVLVVVLLAGARHTRHPTTRMISTGGVLLVAALVALTLLLHLHQRPVFIAGWIHMLASTVAGVLVMFGILLMWRSRLAAYRMFHHAVLVSILIAQVFAFYEQQIMAVVGLFLQVLVLMALRFMIGQEERWLPSTAALRR